MTKNTQKTTSMSKQTHLISKSSEWSGTGVILAPPVICWKHWTFFSLPLLAEQRIQKKKKKEKTKKATTKINRKKEKKQPKL